MGDVGNAFRLGIGLAALASCATTQARVTAGAPPTSQPPGQALYEDRCGRCHDAVPAHAYPRPEWPAVVRRMSAEARLSELEVQRILLWLQEAR
jgi:hypothetical protein